MDNTKEIVQRIETEIGKLKDKSFKVLFYVPDAKNNATGYISYICLLYTSPSPRDCS